LGQTEQTTPNKKRSWGKKKGKVFALGCPQEGETKRKRKPERQPKTHKEKERALRTERERPLRKKLYQA